MYKLIKFDSNGNVYEVTIESDKALLEHLHGTFEATNHKLIAVIRIITSK